MLVNILSDNFYQVHDNSCLELAIPETDGVSIAKNMIVQPKKLYLLHIPASIVQNK